MRGRQQQKFKVVFGAQRRAIIRNESKNTFLFIFFLSQSAEQWYDFIIIMLNSNRLKVNNCALLLAFFHN